MDPRTLRAELDRVRERLRRLFAAYGVLQLVAVLAPALLLAYLLDRTLSLPAPVRLTLLALLGVLAVLAIWRGLVYPLRKRVRAEDVALAVERRYPELDGGLISVLELDGPALDPDRNVSAELVETHRREMEGRLRGVDFSRIFEYRHLRRVALAAAVLLAVDAGYAAMHPELTGIFFRRLAGGAERWPQRTYLSIEFPESAGHFVVEHDGERPARVRIARGASLPVTVRVKGEQPEFVELHASGSPAVALAPTGGAEWVGRFRNVRESFEFQARGGDDDGAGRAIRVEVFPPPSIERVATSVRFPAYTGLAARVEPRGDVEAPVGSEVTVLVDVREALESGALVFEAQTGELALAPPGAPDVAAIAAEAGMPDAWSARFTVTQSCTYAVHLVGETGFRNLEPATFAVIAVQDRPPSVKVLEPASGDVDVTPNGLRPVRVAAADDYGIASLTLTLGAFGADQPATFDLLGAPRGPRKQSVTYTLVDLATTAFAQADGPRLSQAGDSFVYGFTALDNFAPAGAEAGPNRADVPQRRIDVISPNEMLRTLAERQIRRKDDVRALRDLQLEKHEHLKRLLADYDASEGDLAPEASDLAALEIGQNQVSSRAARIAGEFAESFETYLLNRLDGSAAAERIVPILAERKRASTVVDGVDFGVYRPIAQRYQAGEFGALDVLGRLLDMLSRALDVAEVLSPKAGAALGDARLLVDPAERPSRIREALAAQEDVLRRLDELLDKMDEWEDFQEILTLFRGILDDQRRLNAQTRDVLRAGAGGDSEER